MCRLPVTLGGGMTMVHGVASPRSGRNSPRVSQCSYQRCSIGGGLEGLGKLAHGPRLTALQRSINLGGNEGAKAGAR